MTTRSDAKRWVLDAEEVGVMAGLSPNTVRARAKKHGHVLGVAPLPDTGRCVRFPRIAIEQALGIQEAS